MTWDVRPRRPPAAGRERLAPAGAIRMTLGNMVIGRQLNEELIERRPAPKSATRMN